MCIITFIFFWKCKIIWMVIGGYILMVILLEAINGYFIGGY